MPIVTDRNPRRTFSKFAVLLLIAVMDLGGCGSASGRDPGLLIGGRARLISADGSAVILEVIRPQIAKGARVKKPASGVKVEKFSIPVGTEAVVLAIDGDDVRIHLEGSPHAGLITWVESAKLDPLGP